MSATNRGDRGGGEHDFFPTPAWCVHRLLEAVDLPLNANWLEPCVGGWSIVEAVADWRPLVDATLWTTVDIRPDADADITADFTWMGCPELGDRRFDVCCTNPPFGIAEEFVRGAMARCDVVVMLLRLSWLASETRADFLRENTPSVYVLPNRPSFTGDGKTDAADYAWMVWGLDDVPRLEILKSTPADERRMKQATLDIGDDS